MTRNMNPAVNAIMRAKLQKALVALRRQGPAAAGKAARVEAVLSLPGWPFDREVFSAFCKELGL